MTDSSWQIADIVGTPVRLPAHEAPRLLIAVHTEEEFAWGEGFFSRCRTISHIDGLARAHAMAGDLGFAPTYFCTSPVLESEAAIRFLRNVLSEGSGHLGTHLHPWVTPPLIDEVPARDSYPGNLPRAMEQRKLARLTDDLADAFGERPIAYLAGRYGYGPNTSTILRDLGYQLDLSIAPGWSYTGDGGPDLRDMPSGGFWNRQVPALLHVAHTGGYAGFLSRGGRRLLRTETLPMSGPLRLPSIAARLGAQRPTRLTIEGTVAAELERFARHLVATGERLFVLSFHSPSMAVGGTPYVPDEAALADQLERYRRFLRFFADSLGGCGAGPREMLALARGVAPASEQSRQLG